MEKILFLFLWVIIARPVPALQSRREFVDACIKADMECAFEFEYVETRPIFGLFGTSKYPFSTTIKSKEQVKLGKNQTFESLYAEFIKPVSKLTAAKPYNSERLQKNPFQVCTSYDYRQSALCHDAITGSDYTNLAGHCIRLHFSSFDKMSTMGNKKSEEKDAKGTMPCVVFRTA